MNKINTSDTADNTAETMLSFESVEHDAYSVRKYNLKNGLTVYLAKNTDAPRIETYIAVKAGSNQDPAAHTGLAHYLEHMMFKGSSSIGTLDWEKEKPLLEQIEELFELHARTTDIQEKKNIYQKIDALSQETSKFAIPNEYDMALNHLGAIGTNAHTWFGETIYKTNIPKTALEKWLILEKDRFENLALRLFHTELETVYEEYNRGLDEDGRVVNQEILKQLFPEHPLGTQPTIGHPQHLKNPSMRAIKEYYQTYYTPENMAVILVGDLDFDSTIALVDQYFGQLQKENRDLPPQATPVLPQKQTITELSSPSGPRLQLAWAVPFLQPKDRICAKIISEILSNNGETGLLDLEINQKQRALYAISFLVPLGEVASLNLFILPKADQTLDMAAEILRTEVEKIIQGEYPEELIHAIISDMMLSRLKAFESATGLGVALYTAFISGRNWSEVLHEPELMKSITPKDISDFAQKYLNENFVMVKKIQANDKHMDRVENPGITPIKINRGVHSNFYQKITSIPEESIQPEFLDFQKLLNFSQFNGHSLVHIPNSTNDLAEITFNFPLGQDHDRDYKLAFAYFELIGTPTESPAEIRQQMFYKGISYRAQIQDDRILITLSGLYENLVQHVDFYFHWLFNAKADPEVYQEFIDLHREERSFMLHDKGSIQKALMEYAKFGLASRFRDIPSMEELALISPEDLVEKLQQLFTLPFEIFYYGKKLEDVKMALNPLIKEPSSPLPQKRFFAKNPPANRIYFYPYEMVQVEMNAIADAGETELSERGAALVLNEYYGRGLSSVVFQELRESRSLAYSAFISYQQSTDVKENDYIRAHLGTQPDKITIAQNALSDLMQEMPYAESQFQNAKDAALKKIASTRTRRVNIYYSYLSNLRLGSNKDLREMVYHQIKAIDFSQLNDFFKNKITKANFTYTYLGNKEMLMKNLKNHQEMKELTPEDLFNFGSDILPNGEEE